jgi:hypothetical protein
MTEKPLRDFSKWAEKKFKPEVVFVILALAAGMCLTVTTGPFQAIFLEISPPQTCLLIRLSETLKSESTHKHCPRNFMSRLRHTHSVFLIF